MSANDEKPLDLDALEEMCQDERLNPEVTLALIARVREAEQAMESCLTVAMRFEAERDAALAAIARVRLLREDARYLASTTGFADVVLGDAIDDALAPPHDVEK